MIFEWDENKAKINFAKHKVTFEEAQTVFYDEEALLIADEKHSDDEGDEIIRIISSRKANKKESEQYWKRRSP